MKEARIIRKIKRLLRQAHMPAYLHRFGPKKYRLWQHMLALLIKQECRLSYRRVASLLTGLGAIVPTYSALCKMNKRMPTTLWRALLAASAGIAKPLIAAIDATFYSARNPSQHYLNRCGKKPPKTPVQLTGIREVCRQKWLAIKVHNSQVGEAPQAKPLLNQLTCKPLVLTADKAYDAEYIHEYAYHHNILTVIPSKRTTKRGFYRRQMKRRYNERLYHRRSLIESAFSAAKRRSGSHLLAHCARMRKAELHARFTAQNLNLVPRMEIFN